jgi:hypothetical protein
MLINGVFVEASDGRALEVENPAKKTSIATVQDTGGEECQAYITCERR